MPKVKAIHTIGVAHLLGSYSIQNADGVIPNGAKLELSEELIDLIGRDSFEPVAAEESNKNMSEETTPTPETPVVPETPVTPEEVKPEATPETPVA